MVVDAQIEIADDGQLSCGRVEIGVANHDAATGLNDLVAGVKRLGTDKDFDFFF